MLRVLLVGSAGVSSELRRVRALEPQIRRVVDDVAAALPASVVAAVDRGFEVAEDRFNSSPNGHQWWPWRSGVLPEDQQLVLRAAVEPVELPAGADGIWELAAEISAIQTPMLAAVMLRDHAPSWWAALPWVEPDLTALRIGEYLTEVKGDAAAATGQGALIAEVQKPNDGGLWSPDLPKSFGISDQAKLFIATRAFLTKRTHYAGDWTELTARCVLCGAVFFISSLFIKSLVWAGGSEICRSCVDGAENANAYGLGHESEWGEVERAGALDAIRAIADELGGPPSKQQALAPLSGELPGGRARAAALRMALPARAPGAWSWWLGEAGVIPDGWRPSRGVISRATDGHMCRSLFERHVDDWLHHHGYAHELEPSYPAHPVVNPRGALRADWLLEDGRLIEAAGMLQDEDYAAKMRQKQQLALEAGLDLVIITPTDLADLSQVIPPG